MKLADLLWHLDDKRDLTSLSLVSVAGGYDAQITLASRATVLGNMPGCGRSADPVEAIKLAYADAKKLSAKPAKQPLTRFGK